MKSSIKIDLGPSIKVQVVSTDDVRDKLMKQFFEKLGYSSNLAYIHFEGVSKENGEAVKDISIYPIGAEECTSKQFMEEAYFRRMEICPAQCARLIPLCYGHLDPVQQQEVNSKVFDIAAGAGRSMETLHHVEGIYYSFCATSSNAELTMNCDGTELWFSLPTYNGGSGLSTKALIRKELEKLSTPDLAKLILGELNTLTHTITTNGTNS